MTKQEQQEKKTSSSSVSAETLKEKYETQGIQVDRMLICNGLPISSERMS